MAYAIRRVGQDEWERLRALRLAALADTPIGFGMRYADALHLPDEYWQDRARREATESRSALFVAAQEGSGEWVGMAGGFLADELSYYWQAGRERLVIFSVFVDPGHRGRARGVNVLLFDAVVGWAGVEHPSAQITLGVHEDNARAYAFYQRYGFVDTGRAVPYNLEESSTVLLMDYQPGSGVGGGDSVSGIPRPCALPPGGLGQ
ncbi:MAG TPA: N-acetyltransferase [Actinocrinis sp.]|nr:N-acetyltransferase [Actinocrinis sp.]